MILALQSISGLGGACVFAFYFKFCTERFGKGGQQ